MGCTFVVQPEEVVDHITESGRELKMLPYPFFVDEKTGLVGRQDHWKGDPYRLIGFAADPEVCEVNLLWKDAVKDPSKAVGMYPVTEDKAGDFSTHLTPIKSVKQLNGVPDAS